MATPTTEKNERANIMGAIAGGIICSACAKNNSDDITVFDEGHLTEGGAMTIATMSALQMSKEDYSDLRSNAALCMTLLAGAYPTLGYSTNFKRWANSEIQAPYDSLGAGAALRVSPVAYFADSPQQAAELAVAVTAITHNHPEAAKAAVTIAVLTWRALHGATKKQLRRQAEQCYDLSISLADVKDDCYFDKTCSSTVPLAITCFLESTDYEDCIRKCIRHVGSCDVIATVAGGIAAAFYGIPWEVQIRAMSCLTRYPKSALQGFIAHGSLDESGDWASSSGTTKHRFATVTTQPKPHRNRRKLVSNPTAKAGGLKRPLLTRLSREQSLICYVTEEIYNRHRQTYYLI